MTLRERLGLPTPAARPAATLEIARCACRFPDRHYGDQACGVDESELPLGPSGYCWGCWSARHDLPPDNRPEWLRRAGYDQAAPIVAKVELRY